MASRVCGPKEEDVTGRRKHVNKFVLCIKYWDLLIKDDEMDLYGV